MGEQRSRRLGLADANRYCIGWVNKALLCSTGSYIQYPEINHSGKNIKRIYVCMYVCVYIYMYIYICICIYMCVCIYM